MPVKCVNVVNSVVVTSPIGDIRIEGCTTGLHSVKQCDEDDTTFKPDKTRTVAIKHGWSCNCRPVQECVDWLKQYFSYRIADINIPPLCSSVWKKDTFRGKALSLLPSAAPLGSTISYKHLAHLCGNDSACRAAGGAMSNNPISFLIPCHRVINSQGQTGNYSHGKKNNIKKWLLAFETGAETCEK